MRWPGILRGQWNKADQKWGRGQLGHPEKHEQMPWPHASNCTNWEVPRHSRVRRKTAVIGGLHTIVLLVELEHFVGVPSIGLRREKGECFKTQKGKQHWPVILLHQAEKHTNLTKPSAKKRTRLAGISTSTTSYRTDWQQLVKPKS